MIYRLFLSSILATTALAGARAAAQEPSTVSASSDSMNEIIVTAQKRNERLSDVPIAITVITGDALNRAAAKTLSELQGVAPGIYIPTNSGYGGAPISIRGTAGASAVLLDDPVAVYINGVYQSSGAIASTALVDIGTIEIVRGPQGTLQGRNATAGGILINTPDPTDVLSGYARGTYADPAEVRIEGAVSGPLSDSLSVRLAAGYFKEEGWGKNRFDNSRIGGGHGDALRLTMRWKPTDDLDLRLTAGRTLTYAEPAFARWAQTNFNPAPGPLVIPGTATPAVPLPQAAQNDILENNNFALNSPNFNRITDNSLALSATYSLGGVDLVSITGYNDIASVGAADSDGFADPVRMGFNTGSLPVENFSQELRAQSDGSGRFSWILGLYYFHQDGGMDFVINNLQLTGPNRTQAIFDAQQTTRSYAAFADSTLELVRGLSIIGGVRYTRETKDFGFDRRVQFFDTQLPVIPDFSYRPAQAVFTDTSFRAKVVYKPNEDLMLYAGYSTGFKSGGFNAFGTDPAFAPERLRSAEIGLKADFLDRRGSIALAAYSNRYDDLQIRAGVPTGGVAIFNAADSKIEGFEAEGSFAVTSDLRLSGNVSYTNARFLSFPLARNLLDRTADATGNQLPRTPRWQYYLQTSYTPALGNDVVGLIEASWRYRSTVFYYQTDQQSPAVQGEPLGELGLRIGATWEAHRLTATLFGTNLLNDRSVANQGITFSYPLASFNRPRSIGMQIEKKF